MHEEHENENEAVLKKDNILERINKRNKERLNCLDVKLEQRNKENLKVEGVDYFAQTFAERTQEVGFRLMRLNEAVPKKLAKNEDTKDLAQQFTDLTMQIQELQRYLTVSTMFLSDYKIKACQNELNELQTTCEETRQRLMPKKKFGFSGKKVTTKEKLNPKVTDVLDMSTSESSKQPAFTWTLSQHTNEHIILRGKDVNDKDITIANMQGCLIELQGHAGSVQLSHTTNCTLLCGPVARSVFAEHCNDFTLAAACQQLRLHSSKNCRLYMQVTCRAVIEDCSQIDISSYAYDYDTLNVDFEKSGLQRTLNNYKDVADFNWLSPDMHSPNWQLAQHNLSPDWQQVRLKYKPT